MDKPIFDLKITSAQFLAWKGIVLHHSAGPDTLTRDWGSIVKYHTSFRVDYNIVDKAKFEELEAQKKGKVFERPWIAVGYHGGIELVADKPSFNWGRSLSMAGAHAGVAGCSNAYNKEYIGLCVIGNYDIMAPRQDLWAFTLEVTRGFMETFRIPKTHVIGHREVYDKLGIPRQKSCPGKKWDMDFFRAEL